ncbi:MAG: ATP-binding protein [Dehalococcoidia bacterium]|nr:ATP-binding protein [Dehalococcoidia bacterium]
MVNFEWHAIRPLNGTKTHGFEELCAQLARSQTPQDAIFVRKGSPDAGVECYCTLPDSAEWGWQAKYFFTLGDSQWDQLDHSVKRALDKHPNLTRYFVCVPMDRADPRIEGRRFAFDKWNERVEKWRGWAEDKGMNVEFVWWGNSELVEILSRTEHLGRVWFWFDSTVFTQQWFEDRLEESIRAAGPRYTPEIHVELEIAEELETFGQSESASDRVKALAPDIQREFRDVRRARSDAENEETKLVLDKLLEFQSEIRARFSQVESTPEDTQKLAGLEDKLTSATATAEEAQDILYELESDDEPDDSDTEFRSAHTRRTSGDLPDRVFRLRSSLFMTRSFIGRTNKLANSSLMILNGDAGTGKTHLLCDFASNRIETGAPTVLLLGHRFRDSSEPWTQILQQVGIQDANTEMLIGALEAAAQAANQRALVIVDAINEGDGRRMWPDHLPAFLARVNRSPWIATLLSVRSTYEKVVIPDEVREQAETRTHIGFDGREYDAAKIFFSYYGIEFPSTPILRPEFRNPLLLKLICKGLKDRGETRLPRGFHGITEAFDFYLDSVNERLAISLDYHVNDQFVRRSLERVADNFVETGTRWMSRKDAERMLSELLPRQGHSRSLYNGLVSEGVLFEDIRWSSAEASEERKRSFHRPLLDLIVSAYKRTLNVVMGAVKKFLPGEEATYPDDRHAAEQNSGGIAQYFAAAEFEPFRSSGSLPETVPQDVVFIAYERFADHMVADRLLSRYLEITGLRRIFCRVFLRGRELAFLGLGEGHTHHGLIEAMCIQVPERTERELVSLVSEIGDNPYFPEAFIQSIVWRNVQSLPEDTSQVLDNLMKDRGFLQDVVGHLLTVSIVPNHRFNADFLDDLLRRYTMPERDEWWSTSLHNYYGSDGAIDRILDWAPDISSPGCREIEPAVIDLTATVLAWMLSASDRFVRDRATKALVALLSNRLEETGQLVRRFSDVDDPYIVERIYAVAYGVAMRSHDPPALRDLASAVFERVFSSGSPPAQILLRDYARGVVERAAYLGAELDIDLGMTQPPYSSKWPDIPSEEEVNDLICDLSSRETGGEQFERGWRKIRYSVMGGDFDRYVIGENSRWLNVALDEPSWQSPDERLSSLLSEFSDSERQAWEVFSQSDEAPPTIIRFADSDGNVVSKRLMIAGREIALDEEEVEGSAEAHPALDQFEQERENAYRDLMSSLTEEHRSQMKAVLRDRNDTSHSNSYRFDPRWIQRYVLWRVFDLGWTAECFGPFDEWVNRSHGRNPDKPERIGKKYQWIAYREILAYISDHFQYREVYTDGMKAYLGTWQEGRRDIDPSCVLASTPGGTSWEGNQPSWWSRTLYASWDERISHEEWIKREDDIPDMRELIGAVHSEDGARWLPIRAHLLWKQPRPADVDPMEADERELRLDCTGYFVRKEDAGALLAWAHSVNLWDYEMPEPPEFLLNYSYLGEYGWSPAFSYHRQNIESEFSNDGWTKPRRRGSPDDGECPAAIRATSYRYIAEPKTHDCSVSDGYSLQIPHHDILDDLGLRWSGQGADYVDRDGNLAAFDPTAHEAGPSTLLIREDLIREYLDREGLALCWEVIGEKVVIGSINREYTPGFLRLTGAYLLQEGEPEGEVKTIYLPPRNM